MNETAVKLRDCALTLENDQGFHNEYRAGAENAGEARDIIRNWIGLSASTNKEEREHLRRYFDAIYDMPKHVVNSLAHLPDFEFWKDDVCYPSTVELKQEIDDHLSAAAECFSDLSNSLKEILMAKSTEIIKIETKTFVNGVDISTMEDAAIYQLIATQEAEIEELDKIKNKPKKLKDEITKRQEGISALVSYLDSKAD